MSERPNPVTMQLLEKILDGLTDELRKGLAEPLMALSERLKDIEERVRSLDGRKAHIPNMRKAQREITKDMRNNDYVKKVM